VVVWVWCVVTVVCTVGVDAAGPSNKTPPTRRKKPKAPAMECGMEQRPSRPRVPASQRNELASIQKHLQHPET